MRNKIKNSLLIGLSVMMTGAFAGETAARMCWAMI